MKHSDGFEEYEEVMEEEEELGVADENFMEGDDCQLAVVGGRVVET